MSAVIIPFPRRAAPPSRLHHGLAYGLLISLSLWALILTGVAWIAGWL